MKLKEINNLLARKWRKDGQMNKIYSLDGTDFIWNEETIKFYWKIGKIW